MTGEPKPLDAVAPEEMISDFELVFSEDGPVPSEWLGPTYSSRGMRQPSQDDPLEILLRKEKMSRGTEPL